nr:hypothetical protein [Mucilaginibacter sp. L294]
MKNRDILGVLAASALSITMFVRANYLQANGLPDFLKQSGLAFFILQLVIILKYVTGSLMLMPDSFRTRQILIGFMMSDLFIAFFCIVMKSGFPLHMVVVQFLLIVFCLVFRQRELTN